jgi:hypothetical protein
MHESGKDPGHEYQGHGGHEKEEEKRNKWSTSEKQKSPIHTNCLQKKESGRTATPK